MPKEIVHLYLADRLWEVFQSVTSAKLSAAGKILFLIGSLFPDFFFYSPFSYHYSMGENLHKFEGRAFYDVVKEKTWDKTSSEEKAFLAGMITHFLADGHWHPTINDVAQQMAEKIPGGYSQVFYHRLLESFMQVHMLSKPEQDKWIEWLKNNYTDAVDVATSAMEKLIPIIGHNERFSRTDVKTIIFFHELSLRVLHSSIMREKRAGLLKVIAFQSFSPLIPPSPDEHSTFVSSIPAESEKVDFIFSKDSVQSYFRLVSSLFQELP